MPTMVSNLEPIRRVLQESAGPKGGEQAVIRDRVSRQDLAKMVGAGQGAPAHAALSASAYKTGCRARPLAPRNCGKLMGGL